MGEAFEHNVHSPTISHCMHTHRVVPKFSATNIKMTSVYTMLRLCSNHPYLLEFPLTAEEEFRVDEDLVRCAGKIRVLDRLLTALIQQGHKVHTMHLDHMHC